MEFSSRSNKSLRSGTSGLRIVFLLMMVFAMLLPLLYFFTPKVKHRITLYRKPQPRNPITRILHQSWKTKELPPRFKYWSQSWKECYPIGWEFKLWNDTENEQFVQHHYPWFWNTYREFPSNIHRIDSVRYLYMFHYGGIYADLDCECLRPFEHLLEGHELVFGAMSGQFGPFHIKEGYTQNSFMYSTPRHPFWLELLHNIMNTSSGGVEARTGPIILVKTINEYRIRFPTVVKIYAPKYFNPFSWINGQIPICKTRNQMNETEIKECRDKFVNTSFVVQYHSQTWRHGRIL